MTWNPISTITQYAKNAGGAAALDYYLKFYAAGTSTPIVMAADSTGAPTLAKCQLNSLGYPINGSSAVFVPHIDQDYRLVLYTNSTDADANTFGNAAWDVDNLLGVIDSAAITYAPEAISVEEAIRSAKSFKTYAEFVAATDIVLGQTYRTLGYTTEGDGGGNDYIARANTFGTVDGGSVVQLTGSPYRAEGLFPNGVINVYQFGAVGSPTNDTVAFQRALAIGGAAGVYVPFNADGYVITSDLENLWGYGNVSIQGIGAVVSYTDISQSKNIVTASQIAKRLSDGTNVTFATFGDSTMYGYEVGAPLPTDQDPNAPPISLQRTIDNLYGSGVGTVINAAISGTAMFNMMRGYDIAPNELYETRIAPGGVAADADVVYCNHAINDCQSNLSIDTFKRDWIEWVRITRKYGKVPVIVTPNFIVPISGGDARESEQLLMYVNAMRDVAKITSCDIVDNYYYAKKTARRVSESTLVPDGIHPSTDLYKQVGRNLLIPFVSANTLRNVGDVSSLAGSTYLDTASAAILNQPQTRSGIAYNATRNDGLQTGINFAVILDEPFKYLSFDCLQWGSGARAQVGIQDNTSPLGFPRCWKTYGNTGVIKWDTPFTYLANAYAGLNVMYWLFDISYLDPVHNALVLSALSIPRQKGSAVLRSVAFAADTTTEELLLVGQTLTVKYRLEPGVGRLALMDINALETVGIFITAGGDFTVELISEFGVVSSTVISGGAAAADYAISVSSTDDEIIVKAGSYSQHIALNGCLPPLQLSNIGETYLLIPTAGSDN